MTVALRPVEPADIDIFFEHQADPAAAAMAVFPSRDRAAHSNHWTTRVLVGPTNVSRTVLVGGQVCGNVVSWRDAEDGRRLVGYWLGREFWGRGIATDALRLFVDELGDRPLYAYVAATNVASARVLEKAGFIESGEKEIGSDGIEERLFVLA